MARKEKKFHFIYKTVNLLNGKYYIGMHSTDNIEDGYLGSGKRLRYSIRKHGAKNHQREILEYCDSRKELAIREEEIVSLNEIAKVECMNLKVGGQGGFTEEQYKKGAKKMLDKIWKDLDFIERKRKSSSENLKNLWKNEDYRKKKVENNGTTFLGKKHSDETKQKLRDSAKGKQEGSKNSQYGTCWITNGTENKKIKKEDLTLWESKGFLKGRIKLIMH